MTEYLDLADYLLFAQDVLGVEAEVVAQLPRISLADSALNAPRAGFGGEEFYPEFAMKAAVLCSRLIRNHPLPDGNKRVGLLCLREFVERNDCGWNPPEGDPGETVAIVEAVAAGQVPEVELASWIRGRIG